VGNGSPDCKLERGKRIWHTTMQQVHDAFQGRWVLCTEKGLSHEEQDGVEFSGDRWHILRRDPSGTLQPVFGVMNEGGLELLDTSAMNGSTTFQANLELDRGGTVITNPVFMTGPDGLLINNNGVHEYYYVRAEGP
jgi:hypothetical protein